MAQDDLIQASPRSLEQWLAWLQKAHPQEIDLGLERVRTVWLRLGARRPASCVITVGGTNGKGSTVALLEAMLAATGHATGCYTSPHLLHYNERVRLRGKDATDAALIAVFERVEAARAGVSLTWFEFGTLAALELLADADLDVAVLEVGLGGRLDAVNIIDADAAIVTAVGIDHVEYLGPDRDSIGHEKAGIFRPGRPAITGDPDPPKGLLAAVREAGVELLRVGQDFDITDEGGQPVWRMHGGGMDAMVRLEPQAVDAPARRQNLAAALAALYQLRPRLGWNAEAYADAVIDVRPAARMQRLPGRPELVVDVAHNPHAALALAAWLRLHPPTGRTLAVFSALADKDIPGIAAILGPLVDHWYCCPLPDAGLRGQAAAAVCERLAAGFAGITSSRHDSVAAALEHARADAGPDDRILAFGSFHLAAAVLEHASASALP